MDSPAAAPARCLALPPMKATAPRVLLIEDNEDDVFLLRRALMKAQLDVELDVIDDGQLALDYFNRAVVAAQAGNAALPDLVLLDLKLPYVHGLELLAFIRSRSELKGLTVIVLTSSGEPRDQERAAELGPQGYFVKPPTPELVAEVSRVLTARV